MCVSTRKISYGQEKHSFQQLTLNLQNQTHSSPRILEMHISKQKSLNEQGIIAFEQLRNEFYNHTYVRFQTC